jgi:hypothetical protein
MNPKTKLKMPDLWILGKDAGWLAAMGFVCLAVVAISAVLRHVPGIRS